MYTAIGGIINKVTEDEAAVKPVAVIEYLPASQKDAFAALFELKEESAEAAVEAVKSGKLDVFISFPQDFSRNARAQRAYILQLRADKIDGGVQRRFGNAFQVRGRSCK